jgi:hypothetical protein
MQKRFIIEYLAGCKGDFITNWLNYNTYIPHKQILCRSKVKNDQKLKLHDNYGIFFYNPFSYLPDLDELKNQLDLLKNSKFSNSHWLYFYNEEVYKKEFFIRNIKIKKIVFDEKYCQTILIENFFKNINYFKEQIIEHFEKNNIPINEKNQIDFVYNYLSNCKKKYNKTDLLYNKHKKQNLDKDLINYEDLYITFNLQDCDILENLNLPQYKLALEKTWLPEKINVFNHTFNLTKMGYRNT